MKKPLALKLLLTSLLAGLPAIANATSGTWDTTPGTNNWTTGANWSSTPSYPGQAGTTDIATFNSTSTQLAPTITGATITLDSVQFVGVADAFTVHVGTGGVLNLGGLGIVNSSANTQNISVDGGGTLTFQNSASAGGPNVVIANNAAALANAATVFDNSSSASTSTITNNAAGLGTASTTFNDTSSAGISTITNNAAGLGTATTVFNNSSSANGSTITNNGAALGTASTVFNNSSSAFVATITNNGAALGTASTVFNDSSSAGSATITNNGVASGTASTIFNNNSSAGTATITNNNFGLTQFNDSSDAATAKITNNSGGTTQFNGASTAATTKIVNNSGGAIDISGHTGSIAIGEVYGAGNIFLGANNLQLSGLNNYDTISGVIQDGGQAGGTGGSLTKIGNGFLTLTGANTYTGNTEVATSLLEVDGSIASPLTTIDSGGYLYGSGTIGGNVQNNGGIDAYSIYSGASTLTINGNYTQNSGATMYAVIDSPTTFSQIVAKGLNNSISGALYTTFYYHPTPFTEVEIFTDPTIGANTSGTFTSVNIHNSGAALPIKVIYDNPDILLEVLGFSDVSGLTHNQHNTAEAVDGAFSSSSNSDFNNVVIPALSALDLKDLQNALDQISPIGLSDMTEMAISADSAMYGNLTGRFDDIRNGVGSFSSGVSQVPVTSKDGKDKNVQPVVQQEQLYKWSAWISGLGSFGDVRSQADENGNQPGYRFNNVGGMLGADYRVSNNLVFGIAGTYFDSNSYAGSGDHVNINAGKLGAYGTWWQDGAYVQGYVGGGFNSYDTRRDIRIPGIDLRTASGETNSGEVNALLGAGYDWTIGGFKVGPTVAAQYDYVSIDGFQETGADSLNLGIHRQNVNSLQSLLGARASYLWQINDHQSLVPYVSAKWEHEYLDRSRDIHADLQGQDFSVTTGELGRDGVLVNAGVTMNWSARLSTSVSYQGEIGRSNYSSNSVFGTVGVKF